MKRGPRGRKTTRCCRRAGAGTRDDCEGQRGGRGARGRHERLEAACRFGRVAGSAALRCTIAVGARGRTRDQRKLPLAPASELCCRASTSRASAVEPAALRSPASPTTLASAVPACTAPASRPGAGPRPRAATPASLALSAALDESDSSGRAASCRAPGARRDALPSVAPASAPESFPSRDARRSALSRLRLPPSTGFTYLPGKARGMRQGRIDARTKTTRDGRGAPARGGGGGGGGGRGRSQLLYLAPVAPRGAPATVRVDRLEDRGARRDLDPVTYEHGPRREPVEAAERQRPAPRRAGLSSGQDRAPTAGQWRHLSGSG